MVLLFRAFSLVAALGLVGTSSSTQQGLPLHGAEAEAFLREAEVVETEDVGVGVTQPKRLVLSDGERRFFAVWKTVDIHRQGITRFNAGGIESNFSDCYEYEIAAYELDKLLGLGLVPPTVERRIRGETGALQLWVDDVFTDWDRRERKLAVPGPRLFVERKLTVRLFDQLTYNVDYRNARNILIGADGYVWSIDHSRAFRLHGRLIDDLELSRFSRAALSRLRQLSLERLEERLSPWLTRAQIEAILERRDRIVETAERLIAERGELAVLFP